MCAEHANDTIVAPYGAIEDWDVSKVTNFNSLFGSCKTPHPLNLSKWNTSGVTDMTYLFVQANATIIGIGHWDTKNVQSLYGTFAGDALFDMDWTGVGDWDTSSVTNMNRTFFGAPTLPATLNWTVSSVTQMVETFGQPTTLHPPTIPDITGWDVSSVQSMAGMFSNAAGFNQDISGWNVSSVTDMSAMFNAATSFNQNISGWDVANVTDMSAMFDGAVSFSQNLSSWNLTGKKVDGMFDGNPYCYLTNSNSSVHCGDQALLKDETILSATQTVCAQDANSTSVDPYGPIEDWDVSKVTSFYDDFQSIGLFDSCNTPHLLNLSKWNTSGVTDMAALFDGANANFTGVGKWDMTRVNNANGMFASFAGHFDWSDFDAHWKVPQYVSGMFDQFSGQTGYPNMTLWDTSQVQSTNGMFEGTTFNQDISGWNVASVTDMAVMFYNATSFSQNLSSWDLSGLTQPPADMFANTSTNCSVVGSAGNYSIVC